MHWLTNWQRFGSLRNCEYEANSCTKPKMGKPNHSEPAMSKRLGRSFTEESRLRDKLQTALDAQGRVRGIGSGHLIGAPVQVVVKMRFIKDEEYPPPTRKSRAKNLPRTAV